MYVNHEIWFLFPNVCPYLQWKKKWCKVNEIVVVYVIDFEIGEF